MNGIILKREWDLIHTWGISCVLLCETGKKKNNITTKYYLGLILGLKSAIITFKEVITENYIGRQSTCYNIFTVSQM